MARIALRIALLSAAFAVATLLFGWWGVPVVAIAWGTIAWRTRGTGLVAALAAIIAWAGLLGWSALRGPVGELASTLGSVMGAPGVAIVGLTLVFPAALAWAGARLSAGITAIVTARGS